MKDGIGAGTHHVKPEEKVQDTTEKKWNDMDMNEAWCAALVEAYKVGNGQEGTTFYDWLQQYLKDKK